LNVLSALEAGGVGYWELSLPKMTLQVSARGKALAGPRRRGALQPPRADALLPDGEARRAQLEAAIEAGREYDLELRVTGRRARPAG